jgi:hypothetical protein
VVNIVGVLKYKVKNNGDNVINLRKEAWEWRVV